MPTIELARSRGRRIRPNNVIAAHIRAKLFGLEILTLDARVVHAPAAEVGEVGSLVAQAQAVTPLADRVAHQVRRRRDGQPVDLAYALRLLQEGAKSLDEARGARTPT
jgi:hypothetical protein